MPAKLKSERATNDLAKKHTRKRAYDGTTEEKIVSNSFAPDVFDIYCGPSRELGLTKRQVQRRLKGREFTDNTIGKVFTLND